MSNKIRVVVLGAGGLIGGAAIRAMLTQPDHFIVTGVTRENAAASLSAGVRHVKLNYSFESLVEVFTGQDVVISAVSGDGLSQQITYVDAAIKAGVKWFIPSEYGVDTANPAARTLIPFLEPKVSLLAYLRSKEHQISWTAVVCGSIFDWALSIPGYGGLDIPSQTATLYDGGDIVYDATTSDQTGRALRAVLENPDITKNQHVYVNSFAVTQTRILDEIQKITGKAFDISHGSSEELWQTGADQNKSGEQSGLLSMIAAAFYQKGAQFGVGNYSQRGKLWNTRLGLSSENLEEVLRKHMQN